MSVKILDAGGKLLLSSDLRCEVEVSLNDYINRGAKVISVVQKLGTFWVAACTLPPKDAGTSTTLHLSDSREVVGKPASDNPDFDDNCTVEEVGYKRIITGPNRKAVETRIEHLKQFGAELVSDIEQYGDSWTAVVDTGGTDKSYRW